MKNFSRQKNLEEELEKGILWYISDQLVLSRSEFQRRTIYDRMRFILNVIVRYQQEHLPIVEIRILEARCGDGVLLNTVGQIKKTELYGLDYNPLRVHRVRENVPKAKIYLGDLLDLKMEENFFDIVILSQVLGHIKDDLGVLKSLNGILQEKGLLIIGFPNEGCLLGKLRNSILQKSILKNTDHVNFYTEKVIKNKLKSAGFVIESCMYENFFVPHQLLHVLLSRTSWGYRFLTSLGKVFKSQTAGFYFVYRKAPI